MNKLAKMGLVTMSVATLADAQLMTEVQPQMYETVIFQGRPFRAVLRTDLVSHDNEPIYYARILERPTDRTETNHFFALTKSGHLVDTDKVKINEQTFTEQFQK